MQTNLPFRVAEEVILCMLLNPARLPTASTYLRRKPLAGTLSTWSILNLGRFGLTGVAEVQRG